jgi:hypothetical protein
MFVICHIYACAFHLPTDGFLFKVEKLVSVIDIIDEFVSRQEYTRCDTWALP